MEEPKQQAIEESQQPELPRKKWNSPIARVVCWNCKGNRRPLTRLRDENGKKTQDYRCDICTMIGIGRPPIANQSLVHFQYRIGEGRSN